MIRFEVILGLKKEYDSKAIFIDDYKGHKELTGKNRSHH